MRRTNGARAVPAGLHMLGNKRYRVHRIKRGCCRSRRTSATNPPRQSRSHGAPRTVHPTAVSETNVAAYDATGAENHTSRLRKNVPYRNHRRGRRPRRPFRWIMDDVGSTRQPTSAPAQMVRGRCPRDWIRGEADITVSTVGNAVAGGHAERPHPPHPGNHATAGRRGRRPLRVVAKRRYQHRGKQLRKRRKPSPTPSAPLKGELSRCFAP